MNHGNKLITDPREILPKSPIEQQMSELRTGIEDLRNIIIAISNRLNPIRIPENHVSKPMAEKEPKAIHIASKAPLEQELEDLSQNLNDCHRSLVSINESIRL